MKTMSTLKSKELRVAGYIAKLNAFLRWLEGKVSEYTKNAIEGLQGELRKQRAIREDYLESLALETQRINNEIKEITAAHDARNGG